MNLDFSNLFEGAFEAWGIEEWLIIGVGALILILVVFILLKPKKTRAVSYKEVQVDPKISQPVTESLKVEPKDEEIIHQNRQEPMATDVQTKKQEPVKVAKAQVAVDADEEPKEKVVRYHVSLNKDAKSEFKGQWRVRKEGSKKTIKYFKTQSEAIKYAESLADSNDTSIVIHKRDGSIRKQNY